MEWNLYWMLKVRLFLGMSPVGMFSQGKKANRLRRGAPAVVDRQCKKVRMMMEMEMEMEEKMTELLGERIWLSCRWSKVGGRRGKILRRDPGADQEGSRRLEIILLQKC